jgi:hypothetical protein
MQFEEFYKKYEDYLIPLYNVYEKNIDLKDTSVYKKLDYIEFCYFTFKNTLLPYH